MKDVISRAESLIVLFPLPRLQAFLVLADLGHWIDIFFKVSDILTPDGVRLLELAVSLEVALVTRLVMETPFDADTTSS